MKKELIKYKIYKNFDVLPLFNYSKISETSDLRYLLVLQDYFDLPEIDKQIENKLLETWEKINEEVIEFTGLPNDYKEILRLQRSIALMKVELMQTGDRSIETFIEIKERELLNLQPKQKQTIDESIIQIELILKMQIDLKICTVKKYYGYINYLKKNRHEN